VSAWVPWILTGAFGIPLLVGAGALTIVTTPKRSLLWPAGVVLGTTLLSAALVALALRWVGGEL